MSVLWLWSEGQDAINIKLCSQPAAVPVRPPTPHSDDDVPNSVILPINDEITSDDEDVPNPEIPLINEEITSDYDDDVTIPIDDAENGEEAAPANEDAFVELDVRICVCAWCVQACSKFS